MSSINLHTDEISIKVVYYGPGLGGKTTSLQYMHRALKPDSRGQLISLATGIDRTLYFDFLPVKLPKIRGFTVRMSLYTVPGQVHYNATRKLVLQGADGVVFVADSQTARQEANAESLANLMDNLRGHGMNPETMPLVFQFNKRDLPSLMTVAQMDADLNQRGVPFFETCAVSGKGVFGALKAITKLVLADLKRKGIYEQERKVKAARKKSEDSSSQRISQIPDLDRAFAVREVSGLVHAIETHVEKAGPAGEPAEEAEIAGVRLSELWETDPARGRARAIEELIHQDDQAAAVRRAADLLREHLTQVAGPGPTTAEALLALGVHGAHYVRFQGAVAKDAPTREDALFCLFFLSDIELRLQATRSRVIE
jgi:signal recognition particle receptor subunit beta